VQFGHPAPAARRLMRQPLVRQAKLDASLWVKAPLGKD
jgi:hypothetical protein